MENSIFEKARQLGEMILETEAGKRLSEARYIFDGDEEAQKILFSYTQFRKNLQKQVQEGAINQEEFNETKKKLNEKIKELNEHPIIGEMVRAENSFNNLCSQVIGILNSTISGEEENQGGCSGNCSSCGGCH